MYTLENVSKTYTQSKRQVTALADVTLSIPSGQLVAIQGPTGGGKSTLLQMLGALDRPTSGRISLGEAELSHLPDRKLGGIRAKEIGFVFQGFNLIPTLTAQGNVETALAPLGVHGLLRSRAAWRSALPGRTTRHIVNIPGLRAWRPPRDFGRRLLRPYLLLRRHSGLAACGWWPPDFCFQFSSGRAACGWWPPDFLLPPSIGCAGEAGGGPGAAGAVHRPLPV